VRIGFPGSSPRSTCSQHTTPFSISRAALLACPRRTSRSHKVYAIESATHAKKFLRGLPEQGNKVVTAENPQATVFQVLGAENDTYTIQTHVFYLSVEGAHDVVMHKAKGAREKFAITKNSDGTFSFKAVWCGKFITVDKDGNVDTTPTAGESAKFKVYKK
jgi:hypothetical protein